MGQNQIVPILDVDHLGAAMGGDEALMKHFILRFLENAGRYVDELQARVESSSGIEGKVWSGDVHRLKGAARTVGAMRLAAVCVEAENMEVESKACADAVQCLSEEYDAIRAAVHAWLDSD